MEVQRWFSIAVECIDIEVRLSFDNKRFFPDTGTKTITICRDMDVSEIADEIADEATEAWVKAMNITDKEAIETYRNAVAYYAELYLWGALQELYEMLRLRREECELFPYLEISAEASDGYEERGRSFRVYVAGRTLCDAADIYIDVIASVIGEFVEVRDRLKVMEEKVIGKLPEDAQGYVRMLEQMVIPYRILLEGLELKIPARWWYTIYTTQNS